MEGEASGNWYRCASPDAMVDPKADESERTGKLALRLLGGDIRPVNLSAVAELLDQAPGGVRDGLGRTLPHRRDLGFGVNRTRRRIDRLAAGVAAAAKLPKTRLSQHGVLGSCCDHPDTLFLASTGGIRVPIEDWNDQGAAASSMEADVLQDISGKASDPINEYRPLWEGGFDF
jgi:hypothetical protein